MWTKCDKGAFKICGVTYICNGRHLPNKLATLGASPSKKRLCKLISNSFNMGDLLKKISENLNDTIDVLEDALPHAIANAMKLLAHLGSW